jgi:hypothetical protein
VSRLRAGRPGFVSDGEAGIFFISPPLCPDRLWVPPASCLVVTGTLFLGIKRPEREADHSPPSSAKVKNAWSRTSTPIRLHGVVLG